ncbi:MAG: tetratricopeptide repeat protein [Myxococcales bacterium]|nr:tetratricopeptide repeat protein [Myxococcales bacterium]MCB9643041.1 tetratricopeptide repeat protein [Myxococcales bacterium]
MKNLFEKYIKKAREERDRGDLAQAMRSVKASLYIQPHDDDACVLLIRLLEEMGEFETAVRHLEARIQRAPYHAWSLLELADLLINRLRRPVDGLHWLARLFRAGGMTQTQELRACRLHAEALLDQQRYYDASLFLRRARNRYPNDPTMLFLAGWSAVRLERHEDAIPLLERLTSLEPKNADAHYYLGVAYESLGKEEAMRTAFSLVFQLDQQQPPSLRYRFKEFRQLVEQIARTTLLEGAELLSVVVEPYPDEQILTTFPYDPRRMSKLTNNLSLLPSIGPRPQKRLTLYHWNIERLCFSDEDLRAEIQLILEEEAQYIRRVRDVGPAPAIVREAVVGTDS